MAQSNNNSNDAGSGRRGRSRDPGTLKDKNRVQTHHHVFDPDDQTEHEEEWLVPGHNRYHRFVKKSVNMPPEMEEALQSVLDAKNTPYENVGDIMRHAISRHLQWLHRTNSSHTPPVHLLVSLRGMSRLVDAATSVTNAQETLVKLDKQAQALIIAGDVGEALKLLSAMAAMIDKMPVCSSQKRFGEQFYLKYGKFMSTGGTSLPTPADFIFANAPADTRAMGLGVNRPAGVPVLKPTKFGTSGDDIDNVFVADLEPVH